MHRYMGKFTESATAPRLLSLGFICFPHVADFATLVVNVRLLILQPLARLYARASCKCNESITSDINRASGYIVNNPTLAPQATMWGGSATHPTILNRGAVAHPAAKADSRPVL